MPRLLIETRNRVVHLHERGYSVAPIVERLQEEHTIISRVTLYKLLKKYKERGSVGDRARWPRSTKLEHEHLVFIDNVMAQNEKLSSRQLRKLLEEQWQGLQVSLQTVRRVQQNLGWECTRPKYCQLVREINKLKWVDSAQSPTESWMGVHKTKILSASSRNQQNEASRMVQGYAQH